MNKNETKITNSTTEDYCSHKVSKLLKEKGFGVPTNFYYYEKYYAEMLNRNRKSLGLPERFEEGGVGKQLNSKYKGRLFNRNKYDTTTSRPTHALAIKWIRENFSIHIYTSTLRKNRWHFSYRNLVTGEDYELKYGDKQYNSAEEAKETALT